MEEAVWLVIAVLFICGGIAAGIGNAKNLSAGNCFLAGLFLGVIGIIIVAVQPTGLPKAPAGLRAVRCQMCNAVQNIPHADATFVCWQCKQAGKAADTRSEDAREWLDRQKKKSK